MMLAVDIKPVHTGVQRKTLSRYFRKSNPTIRSNCTVTREHFCVFAFAIGLVRATPIRQFRVHRVGAKTY